MVQLSQLPTGFQWENSGPGGWCAPGFQCPHPLLVAFYWTNHYVSLSFEYFPHLITGLTSPYPPPECVEDGV